MSAIRDVVTANLRSKVPISASATDSRSASSRHR